MGQGSSVWCVFLFFGRSMKQTGAWCNHAFLIRPLRRHLLHLEDHVSGKFAQGIFQVIILGMSTTLGDIFLMVVCNDCV